MTRSKDEYKNGRTSKKIPLGFKILDNYISGCGDVINYLNEQNLWHESQLLGGSVQSDIRNSSTAGIPIISFANPPFLHEINRLVWRAFDEYAREWNFSFSSIEDVSVQRYEGEQDYKPHCDCGPNAPRVASALLYLNTVPSGGETYFTHFNYKVQPIEGRLVLFPSNYIYEHAALPVSSGVKYAAAYWASMA